MRNTRAEKVREFFQIYWPVIGFTAIMVGGIGWAVACEGIEAPDSGSQKPVTVDEVRISPSVWRIHDEKERVTCWMVYNHGISCLRDEVAK